MSTPERVQFLSAVLLTSRDAPRLVGFYRDVLGLPLAEERHGNVPLHFLLELAQRWHARATCGSGARGAGREHD